MLEAILVFMVLALIVVSVLSTRSRPPQNQANNDFITTRVRSDIASDISTVTTQIKRPRLQVSWMENLTGGSPAAKTWDLAEKLNPPVHHQQVGPITSAKRLVKGISWHNKVTLFLRNPITQAFENEQIILDLLSALNITAKIVDVSSDAEMHLGLPQSNDYADLPYLYINGVAFGNTSTILDASRNGELTAALTKAGVTFDTQAAAHLQQR